MNEFRTVVSVPSAEKKIGLEDRFLTIGSCFAQAIGAQLRLSKFAVSNNPFGTTYNPVSIHQLLMQAVENKPLQDDLYVESDGVCYHYGLHSSISALNRQALGDVIAKQVADTHDELRSVNWVLITYGTAWTYALKKTGQMVSNCHKQPSGLFEKSLLGVDEIAASFGEMHRKLRAYNPGIRIILTVSPVRHVRDSLPLNSVSKSVLRVCCHEIASKYNGVEYFPAYELMMDDLRDYRFYKADMIHPTEQAEEYIWNTFTASYMDAESAGLIQRWKSIRAALDHKPFHPASAGHQNFLRQTLKRLEEIRHLIDVDAEIRSVRAQLPDSEKTNTTSP